MSFSLDKYKEQSEDMVELKALQGIFKVLKILRGLWILLLASMASALFASFALYNFLQGLIENGVRLEKTMYLDLFLLVLSFSFLAVTLLERNWARIALKNQEVARILKKYN